MTCAHTSLMAVRVLGPLDVGAESLGPRERTILAALIVRRGSTVHPAELADAWWGDELPATWSQQVRNSVSRIRLKLGRDAVQTVATEYRLGVDPETIDAVRFERLVSSARALGLQGEHDRAVDAYRRALGMWRGAPLQDVASWEPGVAEAQRLLEIRSSVEEELLDARLRTGEHRAILPDAERLVREQPLREDRWAILALANYRAGRQAEALATLRAARERLADELGIEPGERLTALETAVLRQDPSIAAPTPPAVASADCPYPGLRAFGPEDFDLFFGRESDAEEVSERLRPGAVVAIAGASGTGKSSVALAGVVPRLQARGRVVQTVLPGPDIASDLHAAADRAGVVVVDQAEELLALDDAGKSEVAKVAAAFVGGGGTLLLTVRSDSLDGLRSYPYIGDALGHGIYLLGPISVDGCREAIEEPARHAGLRIEPGLTELALRDLGDRSSTLPHFSHALRETWRRREGITLTVAGYQASGGIAGAIAQSAEGVFRSLPPEDQAVCRSVMLRLLEGAPDGTAARRRVPSGPMLADADRRRVIEKLARARLLSVDESAVMVTHEAVATAWPRLEAWLADDQEHARALRAVETAAAAWEADGRQEDDLLRGARLHAALEMRQARPRDLTASESEFLDVSETRAQTEVHELAQRAGRERSRNRILRFALAGVATLLVAVMAAGTVAVVRGDEARAASDSARIEALGASSLALRSSDRDLAALLAVEAYRRWPQDDRVRSALLGFIMASDGLVRRVEHPQTSVVIAPLPSSEGSVVVSDTDQGALTQVLDLTDGRVLRTIEVDLPEATPFTRSISVSPDGAVVVIQSPQWADEDTPGVCCRNHLAFADVESGEELGEVMLDARTSEAVVFSQDGARVFLGNPVTFDVQSVDIRTGEVAASSPDAFANHAGEDGRSNSVVSLAGGLVAVGSPDALIVYDEKTLAELSRIATDGDLTSLSLVADGERGIIGSGLDGTTRIDLDSGDTRWVTPTVPGRPCWNMAVTLSRGAFFCASLGTVSEFDLTTGLPTGRDLPTLVDEATVILPRAADTELLLNAPLAGATLVWRLDGSGAARRIVANDRQLVGGINGDGTVAITTGRLGGPYQLWDLDADRPVGPEEDWLGWISSDVLEVWSEQDGSSYITESGDQVVLSPELTSRLGGEIIPAAAPPGPHAFAFAPRASTFVAFDASTGEAAGPFITVPDVQGEMFVNRVSESADGSRVALTYYESETRTTQTAVFDHETGALIARGLIGTEGNVITHSGDLITVTDTALTRHDVETLEPIESLPKAFSSGTVIELSDDDRLMLVVGWDNRAALYGMTNGVKLADTFDAPSAELAQGAHLTRDGNRLVTSTPEGILVWELDPAVHARAACEIAGRELTEVEWRTYFGDDSQVETCRQLIP
jgi:DNA-binding SARP family transcriptional activator